MGIFDLDHVNLGSFAVFFSKYGGKLKMGSRRAEKEENIWASGCIQNAYEYPSP